MTLLGTETSLPVVVGIHSMLMIGLALVMTPLMTSSLGSVPSELYSHGSAIFNTGQQLAGAAGTALFVTIMSNTAASRLADGSTDIAAQQSGIHTAFVWGGVISLIAVAGSFFIRKPAVTS